MSHRRNHGPNDIWDTPETEHSKKFYKNLMKMAECFRVVVEEIIADGHDEYSVDKLVEIEDTTRAVVDMYDTGFLPTSFYRFSAVDKDDDGNDIEGPSVIWAKIKERSDEYFSKTLASFFTEEARAEFIDGYLDLFEKKGPNGDYLIDDDDRDLLWDWIDMLVSNTIAHEHEIRCPIVVCNRDGDEIFTHKKFPEDSERLIDYSEVWKVDISW